MGYAWLSCSVQEAYCGWGNLTVNSKAKVFFVASLKLGEVYSFNMKPKAQSVIEITKSDLLCF